MAFDSGVSILKILDMDLLSLKGVYSKKDAKCLSQKENGPVEALSNDEGFPVRGTMSNGMPAGYEESLDNSPPPSPPLSIAPVPTRLHMYVPPPNFGAIEAGTVFRSAYPKPEHYDFVSSLGIKTILTLVPEPMPDHYAAFIKEHNIKHIQIHIPANKNGQINITPDRMTQALAVLLDRDCHPLLVHCNRGKHRTGCVTACFRKVQERSLTVALSEYRDYSSPKCRDDDEAFISSYDPVHSTRLAQKHGWLLASPPEPTGQPELWQQKNDSGLTLTDIAAIKLPDPEAGL